MRSVSVTPEISALLSRKENPPVCAFGVSGGKDSHAMALAGNRYLDEIGFTGTRVAVHADLGRAEWIQSKDKCQELANSLGWELMVVKRAAGDLVDRWLVRWNNNVARYNNLECVQLILPWSTASWRFCTSELKSAVVRSNLKRRFPGQDIINAVGIRAQESRSRAKMPVYKEDSLLSTKKSAGYTWNAILDWPVEDVFKIISEHTVALHPAYTEYGMSRVSCAFCVLASGADLQAATTCPDNLALYQELVDLEITSAFSFQSNRWLGDVNPELLSDSQQAGLAIAKSVAKERAAIEARIPQELLYEKGWPLRVPTLAEAHMLAEVRRQVSQLQGLASNYLDACSIRDRYHELIAIRDARTASLQTIPLLNVTPGQGQMMFTF
ncbi:TPA: phosphoadenosine phosphosulfate reductase family protein [Pseudomonas aeruginosa]|nr:phosphoadenosine phosphosulfate reductase family protein [Pseudomonas aeruginosa]